MLFELELIFDQITIGITSINPDLNPYMMFLLSCIAEIIGYIIPNFTPKYSRGRLMTVYLGLASLVSLPVAMIPVPTGSDWTVAKVFVVIFATLGKIFASANLFLMYRYSMIL